MDSKDNGNKGARSYRGQILGDSMAITINFKWLIQIIVATGMLVYAFWTFESIIQALERHMEIAIEEIELHDQERQLDEEKHKRELELQLQEQNDWIEKELNINPFSWGKSKRKRE